MQRRGLRTLNIIKLKSLSFVVTIALAAAVVQASPDWPQWQGPDRTRMSKETGLLKQWPTGGPRVIWTTNNLGTGYGSMSVAGDRVFLQGARGPESVVIALNRADGKEVWAKALGPIDTRMRTYMGAGPRGTPTVDGDRLYVLTEAGDLACLKTDGSPVWNMNILKEFGGSQLQWMISESPVVDGPHLLVSPGGPGAGIVKLDKMTGKTVWTAKELSDAAGYSSITVPDIQGVRTYMTCTATAPAAGCSI
jgi:outer membrane protein assembly factor BamB